MVDKIEVHDVDVSEFTKIVDSCKGNVYMVTPDGDRLNLKSKLCQLIGFTSLIRGGTLASAEIVCDNLEDEQKLFRFNLFGKDQITKK